MSANEKGGPEAALSLFVFRATRGRVQRIDD
jgi:hypothetical protein